MSSPNTAASLSPAQSNNELQQISPSAPPEYLRVIEADANEFGCLNLLAFNANETDALVMGRIIELFAPGRLRTIVNEVFFFRTQTIHVGEISQIPNSVLEEHLHPLPVEFTVLRIHPLLTQAFHNLDILGVRTDLLVLTPRFKTSNVGMEALVIKYKHTKSGAVWCFMFLALLSIAIGVLVGLLTQRADLGVGVSGGVGTFLAIIEAAVFWQSR